MDKVCRLCCSTKFVSNYIFDETTALYLKMSLYLPIKVFKNDRLPQHICDKCSCKVNDIYQFCNETIEVQNRLRRSLVIASKDIIPEDSVDLTLVKDSVDTLVKDSVDVTVIKEPPTPPPPTELEPHHHHHHVCTQTDLDDLQPTQAPSMEVKVKMEPGDTSELTSEHIDIDDDSNPHPVKMEYTELPSYNNNSDSDDMLLINFKKKKSKRKSKLKKVKVNGEAAKKTMKQEFETVMEMEGLQEGSFGFDDDTPFELRLQMMKDDDWMDDMIEKKQQLEEKKDYFCCVCMKECKYKTQMLKHYEKHMKDFGTPAKFVAPTMPKERPLKCNRCCRVVTEEEWAEHWWRHWEKDHRPLRCALCRYTFRRPLAALKHCLGHTRAEADAVTAAMAAAVNEPRFGCDMCELTYATKREVLSHRTVSHPLALGAALALRCSECSRTFAHGTSLRRHMRAHRGVREHLCNICGKALSSREHLKFHIRIHTGYKPNVCKTCGKGFVKKCNLTLHERVHSGEKPHVCPVCGKAFSQRSTLVIHERYHTGARPYVCNLCGRGFVAQGLLSMHLKTTCI